MRPESIALRRLCSVVIPLALSAIVTPAVAVAQPLALACGQVVNASIDGPLEQDLYTFFGEQGDVMTITLVETGQIDPTFSLFGQLVNPSVGGGTIGPFVFFLTQTGTHTIRVRASNSTARGSYALRVGWLLPLSKQCGDRTPLPCGVTVSGAISAPLEQDIFTFFGQQGDTVNLTLVRSGSIDPGFSSFGQLFNPDGTGRGSIGSFNWILTQTGIHVVLVRDALHLSRGTYFFRHQPLSGCLEQTPLPGPPTNFAGAVTGSTVVFTWNAPSTGGEVTSYFLDGGRSAGSSDLGSFDTASTQTSAIAAGLPSGTYFVRVRARNSAGLSPPSNEAVIGIGGACVPPGPPSSFNATSAGPLVTLIWTAPGSQVDEYVIEAGSSPGASNVVIVGTGNASTTLMAMAPPGTYFVRVRARNSCGISAPSVEVRLVVVTAL